MGVESPAGINTAKLDEIIQSFGGKKSNLIAMLQKVQEIRILIPRNVRLHYVCHVH